MSRPTIRCTVCEAEFADDVTRNACPACGTASIPCAIADDVQVTINWHELRCLTIWASNWATDHPATMGEAAKALATILRRLDRFRPKNGAALTLAAEVRELQEKYPSAELCDSDGNVIVGAKDQPS